MDSSSSKQNRFAALATLAEDDEDDLRTTWDYYAPILCDTAQA
jgi:hypothetical protein